MINKNDKDMINKEDWNILENVRKYGQKGGQWFLTSLII